MPHEKLLLALTLIGIVMMAISLVVVPIILIRLPDDYFLRPASKPILSASVLLRNVVGLAFVAVGVVLLFLPGQGVLMIGVGLLWTDFPGKRKLVRQLLGHPKVLRPINRLREQAGKRPLRVKSPPGPH